MGLYNLYADAVYIEAERRRLKTLLERSVYRNNAGFEADYIKVASAENAVADVTQPRRRKKG
jgi:hypothetical protein